MSVVASMFDGYCSPVGQAHGHDNGCVRLFVFGTGGSAEIFYGYNNVKTC